MKRVHLLMVLMVVAFAWNMPALAQEEVNVGFTLAGAEDMNGDGVPDIAVGDPTHGQVLVFSGADGTLLYSLDAPDPREKANVGQWPAGVEELGQVGGDTVVGDVNGDGVSDIAVEDPSNGQVSIFSGANGSLLYILALPSPKTATDTEGLSPSKQAGAARAPWCLARTKYVRSGDWRTLETFWNATGKGYFLHPARAQIKVRYGVGWFGFDRQKQTLDGIHTKTLSVNGGSVLVARMQIKVAQSGNVD